MSPASRVRPGIPDGGRFSIAPHTEAAVSLVAEHEQMTSIDMSDLGRCPVCHGTGTAPSGNGCGVCLGIGSLADDDAWSRAQATESACTLVCSDCDEGLTGDLTICRTCDGTGTVIDYSLAG